MDDLWVPLLLHATAAALALWLARTRREHLPVAIFLVWLTLANPVLFMMGEYIAGNPSPDWARFVFRASWLLRLTVPFFFAAATAWVFRVPAVAYAAFGGLLALSIALQDLQALTPDFLLWLTQAVLWCELALVWPVIVGTIMLRGRQSASIPHLVVIVVAANDVAQLVMPLAQVDTTLAGWDIVSTAESFGFGAVILAQAWFLARRSRVA